MVNIQYMKHQRETGKRLYIHIRLHNLMVTNPIDTITLVDASTVQITVTTDPIVQYITVDSTSYTPPQTFSWSAGSTHTISVPTPQYSSDGNTRYSFSSWSNGGGQTQTITVPSSDTTYTATFTTQDISSSTSFWTGSGSIIRYHGRLLSSNAGIDWPYGISKDVTVLHTSSGNPVGFFQWQVYTNSCSKLKIDAPDLSRSEKKVDITVGGWDRRDQDKTFANVQLPFTLGASNLGTTVRSGDWRVIAVVFKNTVSKEVQLNVDCTSTSPSSASSITGNSVVLEGGYRWNGNGSIISQIFRSLSNRSSTSSDVDWPYGAFQDVTQVHASSENPVVFFQ